jgi:aryl-phospho-beta-D-glucosidase BglC (GH1 family)
MKKLILLSLMSTLLLYPLFSQLTSQEAILQMGRGINVGNSMDDIPTEGSQHGNYFQKTYFDDYVSAGFTCIRIPITWRYHVSPNSPYTINSTWLARVDTVVTWGLNKGLFIIINAQNEDGLKGVESITNITARADTLARYDSIWSQVSMHFKDRSDHLLFEIINEPYPMSVSMIDSFNSSILKIIRKTNPTRIVLYSGNDYSRADQLMAAKIPDINDKYLIGYHHPYNPIDFAIYGTGTYGTTSDINATIALFDKIDSWSKKNNIPVAADEIGTRSSSDYNSRMVYYATMVEQAISHGQSFNAWDDNGWYQIYIRNTRKWDDSKDVLIHTYKESPTQLKAVAKDKSITLTWLNRTILNDSIYVDRRTSNTVFTPIATLNPETSQFYDSLLNYNTVYYYRLRTRLLDSIDLYSYPIEVKISITTIAPPTHNVNNQFTVYPNPIVSTVLIQKPESDNPAKLDIYNILGVKIRSEIITNKETRLSVDGITNGIYTFVITTNNYTETKQIIIQK